jgi:hypothetical protein
MIWIGDLMREEGRRREEAVPSATATYADFLARLDGKSDVFESIFFVGTILFLVVLA